MKSKGESMKCSIVAMLQANYYSCGPAVLVTRCSHVIVLKSNEFYLPTYASKD